MGLERWGEGAIPSRREGKGVEGEVVRTRMRRGWRIVGGGVDILRWWGVSGSIISRCDADQ